MELYACGHNEAGNLNLPAVCVRWHILGRNPCEHNNRCQTPENPPYCPRMVTRLTRVLSTEEVRLIRSSLNSTFLDEAGILRIFGNEPEYLIESRLVNQAREILQIFEPEMNKIAFLMEDGSLWVQNLQPESRYELCGDFEQQSPNQSRKISHLAFQYSGHSSYVIAKSRPQTVVTVDIGLLNILSWCHSDSDQNAVSYTHLTLPTKA